MRYAQIRSMDISNGEGVGVSLFVQGCPFQCKNCFNSDTWDFNGGKEWTEEIKDKFMKLIDRPYIKRVSFLGGECLAEQNLDEVLKLIQEIRISFPEKTIWLYTGYTWEQLVYSRMPSGVGKEKEFLNWNRRNEIISNIDICIDGEYVDNLKDLTLKWRGSKNQRVIDVKQSLAQNKVVLYCD
jgi:anaerobic ribonucleoside-triphosphate reductase activating protein|nr:MAG TPA: anaerobic ribonucleoside-triphosphate reductase activating protein [Caudoviricetes sp.]